MSGSFAIGDVVKLTSGGLRMTVIAAHDDLVTCIWFTVGGKDGTNDMRERVLPAEALCLWVMEDRAR